jgi:transcriptional regulator with XRE-family HTH domain
MDLIRLGRLFRALRQREWLRQVDVAHQSGCSQSAISRLELGHAGELSVGMLDAVARALDARLQVGLVWQGALADRLLDAEHASVVETVIRRLERFGWSAIPEATFNAFGERGSIDVLARHPARKEVLIVEVKTAIGDVQATIAAHDRKVRLAPRWTEARGWGRLGADRLLVVLGTRQARRLVDAHAATFRAAYPDRDPVVRRWLTAPGEAGMSLAGLIFVTPTRDAGTNGRQRVRVPRRPADPHSRTPGAGDSRRARPRYDPPDG